MQENERIKTSIGLAERALAFSSAEPFTPAEIRSFPLEEDFKTAFTEARKEKGISDSACYNAAALDRKLYWNIFHKAGYKPKKRTAIALILTLRPTIEMMDDLLKRLGYCLTHSDRFDVAIEGCVAKKIFDVQVVNEFLYASGLPLLGSYAD